MPVNTRSSVVRFPGVDLEISAEPLRKVVKRGGMRANDKFCSGKMRRMIATESSNELAFLIRAELDPTVKAIYAQALRITWTDSSGPHTHFPDFVIIRDGDVEVHEVKPDLDAASDEVQRVTFCARRHVEERGGTYGLALESVLKAKPVFMNVAVTLRCLHDWVKEDVVREIVAFVQDFEPTTLGAVLTELGRKVCTRETLLTLIARNRLYVDYRQPIDENSWLWANDIPDFLPPLLAKPGPAGGLDDALRP